MQKALAPILAQFSTSECDFIPSYPLAGLTTFRIGGAAELLAVPKSEEALLRLLALLADAGIPRLLIGNGSNLLASDAGYRGVVIRTTQLHQITCSAHTITAGCGAALSAVAAAANRHGIGGFPSLAGIPATVGGAIFMNAGAGNTTVGDRVVSVRAVPARGGHPVILSQDECHFGYRKSIFMSRGLLVLSAELSGEPGDPTLLLSQTAEAIAARRSKQPLTLPSAGSVFKRPPGDYAARLIEAAGLKGRRVGGAAVSEKHAGFIVNLGDARAADVKALVEIIRATVFEQFGVLLEREIEYLGEV